MSDLFDKTRRSFLLKSLLGSTGMLLPTKALSFTNAGSTTNDIPKGNSDREWRKVRSKFILKSNHTDINKLKDFFKKFKKINTTTKAMGIE